MIERYHLFRDHTLIFSNEDNATGSLGAGDCHQQGQPGDVLICTRDKHVARGWYWNKQNSNSIDGALAWRDIPAKDFDPNKYRVLLLLQE